MVWYQILISIALAYLLGSFQTSYIFGKLVKKVDIRNYGSGNPGATNAIRVFGAKFGMVVLVIDALKGALSILIPRLLFGPMDVAIELLVGIFAIVGHNYPFYMGFKGGKGVAASIGIILAVDWRAFLIAGIPALLLLLITRIMSVASLSFEFLSFLSFFIIYFTDKNLFWIVVTAALYPLMSFYRHRKNIINLLEGKEKRLWGKGSEKITVETKDKNASENEAAKSKTAKDA